MFCPNCGAQNPDNATACSNCGFNLKSQGTAAPKFKGTMLMMNSPIAGSVPATPGSQPPGSAPLDPNEPSGRRQMKGTIVGIAPPAPGAAPAPVTPDPSTLPSGGSFAPPGGVGGVNPMGSTFVADDKPVPGFPPPTPGYGGGAPFGSAPQAPAAPPVEVPAYQPPGGGYGAPPGGGYGAPPGGGYGAPPGAPGYGPAPGTPGYGPDPNAGGYGSPVQTPGAIVAPNFGMPSDAGAMVPAGGMGMTAPGAVGTVRPPVTVLALTMCTFGLYGLYTMYTIENELHAFLGDGQKASVLWFLFPIVPLLAMPKLIAQARQKAGTPAQGEGNLVAYLFFGPYTIPNDVNQIWQQLGARPA